MLSSVCVFSKTLPYPPGHHSYSIIHGLSESLVRHLSQLPSPVFSTISFLCPSTRQVIHAHRDTAGRPAFRCNARLIRTNSDPFSFPRSCSILVSRNIGRTIASSLYGATVPSVPSPPLPGNEVSASHPTPERNTCPASRMQKGTLAVVVVGRELLAIPAWQKSRSVRGEFQLSCCDCIRSFRLSLSVCYSLRTRT